MRADVSDYSTLDIDKIKALPVYSGTWRLGDSMGSGCAFDAPGFPSYFIRDHWRRDGNECVQVFHLDGVSHTIPAVKHDKAGADNRHEVLAAFWKALPLDHPRTREWIGALYRHQNHCYRDEERLEYGRPGILIFPVPYYKLRKPEFDERYKPEVNAAYKAAADGWNAQEIERAQRIATPDNHLAVRSIRKFYPEYQPEPELIATPPEDRGHWWERMATRPAPEKCPGEYTWSPQTGSGEHPVNRTWCQMCGWTEDKLLTQAMSGKPL